MVRQWIVAVVAVGALFTAGCGVAEPEAAEAVGSVEQGLLANGANCSSNSQCASGVCADLHTSQAYWPYCYGKVCTVPCEGEQSGDAYCQQVARAAGARAPQQAYCTWFGYESYLACDLAAAGLGTISCE
jgi:hypothetical protein